MLGELTDRLLRDLSRRVAHLGSQHGSQEIHQGAHGKADAGRIAAALERAALGIVADQLGRD